MSNSGLTSAKYFEQSMSAEAAEAATNSASAEAAEAATNSALPGASAARGWDHAMSRISVVVGLALAVGAAAVAVPYLTAAPKFTSASAGKKTYPIDWFLRFGGAKKGQTFEKFIQDNVNRNDLDLDRMFRDSAASKIDSSKWKLQPMPGFKDTRGFK
jgi:hypothetical protein